MLHLKQSTKSKTYMLFDLIIVVLAIYISLWLRQHVPFPIFMGLLSEQIPHGFNSIIIPTVALGAVFVLIQYSIGVYDLWNTSSTLLWLQRLTPSALGMTFASFSYLYAVQNFTFPRSLLFVICLTTLFLSTAWRIVYFRHTLKQVSQVVLLGRSADLKELHHQLTSPPYANNIHIVGIFATDEAAPIASNIPTLRLDDFEKFSAQQSYSSIIVSASDAINQDAFLKILSAAHRGVPIYTVPSIYEILLGRMQNLRINDLPLLELRVDPPSALYSWIKRSFDIALALAMLVICSPLMLVVATLIKLTTDKGSVLFSQIRVGLNGKPFPMIKFRTMIDNAEQLTGAVLASKNDPRITKVGRFLRKTRMDELPQLWNVLKGDMTFVGPRPERPVFVHAFEEKIPGYRERTRVRPGVTGLAQVNGNYESSPETKLKYDLAYITNQSILLDFRLLFRTVKTVLTRAGQ